MPVLALRWKTDYDHRAIPGPSLPLAKPCDCGQDLEKQLSGLTMDFEELGGALDEVVAATCGTLINVAVTPTEESLEDTSIGKNWAARVEITGDFKAWVTVHLDAELARQLATAMFAAEPTDADIEDATKELANMTGGNLKACMGCTCSLSTPVALDGVVFGDLPDNEEIRVRKVYLAGDHLMMAAVTTQPE